MLQAYHLDGVQGADEQRTEQYICSTVKEQAESATQQSAKSLSGAGSFADRQAGAVRSL